MSTTLIDTTAVALQIYAQGLMPKAEVANA